MKLLHGVAEIESGHDYRAVGVRTASGDRAYGKYQVMGSNVGRWTKEYLGIQMSIDEFLNDTFAQEKLAGMIFTDRIGEYGNLHDPVSLWFSGVVAHENDRCDANKTCVPEYIRGVLLAIK